MTRFTIQLEHPGPEADATLALRAALKRLLRDHRLRCVACTPAKPDQPIDVRGRAVDLPTLNTENRA